MKFLYVIFTLGLIIGFYISLNKKTKKNKNLPPEDAHLFTTPSEDEAELPIEEKEEKPNRYLFINQTLKQWENPSANHLARMTKVIGTPSFLIFLTYWHKMHPPGDHKKRNGEDLMDANEIIQQKLSSLETQFSQSLLHHFRPEELEQLHRFISRPSFQKFVKSKMRALTEEGEKEMFTQLAHFAEDINISRQREQKIKNILRLTGEDKENSDMLKLIAHPLLAEIPEKQQNIMKEKQRKKSYTSTYRRYVIHLQDFSSDEIDGVIDVLKKQEIQKSIEIKRSVIKNNL